MTWLYQGRHSTTNEDVVLKLPMNNLYVNPLYRACLQTELKIMQFCSHRNMIIVKERIEDMLVLQPLQNSEIMAAKGRWKKDDIAPLFIQLFHLVAYLHTNEIVHHDLRPGNFFITRQIDSTTSPVLVDMGLAHWRKLPDTLFDSGIGPQGDIRYMAPEQIKGLRGDPRSDLYSLGVMLFYAATGTFPYTGQPGSLQAWLTAKSKVEQTIIQQEQLPIELGRIISKAMACETNSRYQWVEDMRDDLTAYYGNNVPEDA